MILKRLKRKILIYVKEILIIIIYYFDSLKFGIGDIKEPLDFD